MLLLAANIPYIFGDDQPAWFQELSYKQMEAADGLAASLQEDIDEGTAHRVRQSLRNIGIKPIVGENKLRVAMELSKGSDVAFLYMLMDMNYRNNKKKNKNKGKRSAKQFFLPFIFSIF